MTYTVYNKENKKFFAGFTKSGNVKWATKNKAQKMTHVAAKGQAALLICHDFPVQRKPVAC